MNKQAKSKEQLQKEWGYDGKPKQWQHGFSCAMQERDDLIPIINQQAEEIEQLENLVKLLREHNKEITAEVQRKKDGVLAEMQAHNETKNELRALQSRFDELVKSLEGVDKWSLDDVKLRGSDELVESRAIQSLISKAKGV